MKSLLTKVFTRKSPTIRRRPTLAVETLGERTLMAASLTASLNTADGILRVEGTYEDDKIHVRHSGGAVKIDGIQIAVTDGETTTAVTSVPRTQIKQIVVAALDGNDRVEMHDTLQRRESPIPMVIHGNAGEDTLIGGLAADTIYGEGGIDSILGGSGNDVMYGDANPQAAQLARDYQLRMDPFTSQWKGQTVKNLSGKFSNFSRDHTVNYITPDGGLYEWGTIVDNQGTVTDRLIQQLDSSYHDDTRKLEGEFGIYEFSLYYGWGERNEKWLSGIGDPNSDGWYFITLDGSVSRWDGSLPYQTLAPVSGQLLTTLDFSYLADPRELAAAAIDDAAGDSLNGQDGNDYMDGGAGEDFIKGVLGDDTLIGGFGNDVLAGYVGNDLLDGGEGDDSMWGESDNDTLIGGIGNDTMSGYTGNDSLVGGEGNDSMLGEAGLDILLGGDGSDMMRGGNDKDVIAGENDNDLIYGDAGNDELIGCFKGWGTETGNANDTIYGGIGNDSLYGGDGDDKLLGESGFNLIYGDIGRDTLTGSYSNDTLIGGPGNDSLTGFGGDDQLFGEDGSDVLNGNEGRDTLVGGNDNDFMDGGDQADLVCGAQINWAGETGWADDTMYGAAGNDTLWGGDGDDREFGGLGDDWVNGESGRDTLSGGKGNDCLDGGRNDDVIWGGEVDDSTLFFTGDSDTMFGGEGADWLLGGGDKDSMLGGSGIDSLRGSYGHDTMRGEDDNDDMVGGPDNDMMSGGKGEDKLWGESGENQLFGDEGNDELYGGDLKDTLDGGSGKDILNGGGWWDTYRDNVDLSSPFLGGQSITDVNQKVTPTCQTLASIAAAVRQGHDFSKQITSLGNNWYQVRLYPKGKATDVKVYFDGTWTDTDAWTGDPMGGEVGDYWVILLQRARMQLFGINWTDLMFDLSWDVANNESKGQLKNANDAMQTLTGHATTYRKMADISWQNVSDWLASGVMLVACTKDFLPDGEAMVGAHCYAIVDTYIQESTRDPMVTVYNPWGNYQTLSWRDFMYNVAGVVSA